MGLLLGVAKTRPDLNIQSGDYVQNTWMFPLF
jgi:hypothetical protein